MRQAESVNGMHEKINTSCVPGREGGQFMYFFTFIFRCDFSESTSVPAGNITV